MKRSIIAVAVSAILLPVALFADVIRIDESSFTADAGLIKFDEIAYGSVNPVYTPGMYGAGADGATVSFGGYFIGQSISGNTVTGTPTAGLTLDAASPNTFINSDISNPSSPVLSGYPLFNGPVSMVFDKDVAGVGLDGGYFDAIGGTAITAFDRQGNVIGSVLNEGLGIEFLGLVTDDNTNKIAGLQFSIVGSEPAGYAIDNLRFGFADQIQGVPEPTMMLLLGLGLFGCGFLRFRKK